MNIGKKYAMRKKSYPSWRKTYNKCHKENHFDVKCQNVNLVENEPYSDATGVYPRCKRAKFILNDDKK